MGKKARKRGHGGVEGVKDVQTQKEEERGERRKSHGHLAPSLAGMPAPEKLAVCRVLSAAAGYWLLIHDSFEQRHQMLTPAQ